jgi:hypothetical protein
VDAFKLTVVLALVISLGVSAVIVGIAEESIRTSTIPDAESGFVASKVPLIDRTLATHAINLNDGRVLYIQNNSALYDSILLDMNQKYTFNCRIDYNNKIVIIEDVNPQGALVASKSTVANIPNVDYSINLANGRTFYIANNATLFNEIMINQTYLFDCHVNYSNNMLLINGAKLVIVSQP